MIDDESHPEWQAVQKAVFEQVATLANMRSFGSRLIEELQMLCDDATAKAKAHGIEFPDMIVFYMVHSRIVRVYRRDATDQMIQIYVLNLIREMQAEERPINAKELSDSFRRAFPHHHPEAMMAKKGLVN